MTNYTKATLKTFFEQNDIPTGTDYANLIDSQVNIVETATQAMGGALFTPELITARVSATDFNITGNAIYNGNLFTVAASNGVNIGGGTSVAVSAGGSIVVSAGNSININAANGLLAQAGNIGLESGFLLGSGLDLYSKIGAVFVSAGTNATINAANGTVGLTGGNGINITSTFGNINLTALPIIVSASGTTLSTANILTATINRVQGVNDGTATGVKLLSGSRGKALQYVINETAVSANLYPAGSDYRINALTSGAPFPMAANGVYLVVYSQNSAYAVK